MVLGNIELIIGPMFAGKTTLLIDKYNELSKTDRCLAINYALDKRYGEGKIVTHDGLSIDCICIESFEEIATNEKYLALINEATYIFINEAQFFKHLKNWVLYVTQVLHKNVSMCGLDWDFKREPFGELMDLVKYATTVHNLTGTCDTENCLNPSSYSHRVVKNDKQVLIGGTDAYVPLCGECYNKANKE